jgi:hypothetical protein
MTSPDSVFLRSLLWQGFAVQCTCAADLERSWRTRSFETGGWAEAGSANHPQVAGY